MSSDQNAAFLWNQRPNEPILWFKRFDTYARLLGNEYTHRRAYLLYLDSQPQGSDAESYITWTTQANKWVWEERAREWAEYEQFMLEHRWRQRKLELMEADWGTGGTLRSVALRFLEVIQTHKELSRVTKEDGTEVVTLAVNIAPSHLAQLLKTASDLQRLSLDQPTAITKSIEGQAPAVYLPKVDGE